MNDQMSASVVILAGGQSRRLGQDKAGLLLKGLPLLQHAVRPLQPLTDDLILVLRRDQALPGNGPWRVLRDPEGATGVIAGIAAGLEGALHDMAWVIGCDMPFPSSELLQYERGALSDEYDAIVPRLPVGLEPLHALYRRRCLGALHRAIASRQRSISQVLQTLHVRYIEGDELLAVCAPERAFLNVNTSDDLARAERLLSQATDGLACAWSVESAGSGARLRPAPPTDIRPGPPPDDGPRAD